MFRHKKQQENDPVEVANLLGDMPRGVLGRKKLESWMPTQFFEESENVKKMKFRDNSGDFFVGTVGGKSEAINFKDGRIEYSTISDFFKLFN